MMKTYTLGIDLHKRSSVWVMINDKREEIWRCSVACHPLDISKAMTKMPAPPNEIQVAVEPVAGWRWVSEQLSRAGMDVHIANPKKIRLIAESDEKHDRGDARMLAELLRSGFFPESRRIPNDIYDMRTMLRERNFIIKLRTSAKNRLHGIATTQGLHHIKGGNPLHKKGKAAILEGDNVVLKMLHELIDALDHRIAPFDQYVEQEVRCHPVAQLLQTMPCVGPITALTVVAEVGDFAHFASGKKLAKFAGLVPKQRSSGERMKFGSLTNAGSRMLRTALVETAMRIHPKGAPELYAMVERLAPTIGAKKARVALARKLLVIMWTMVMRNIPYQPTTFLAGVRNTRMSDLDTGSGA